MAQIIFDSAWALGYGRTDVGSLSRVYMPSFGLSDSFTLQAAIQQFLWLILRFDSALLGWPTCLPFIGLAFLRRRPDRRDLLCLGAFALVADNLQKIGYNNLLTVAGGFEAWEAAGLAVTRG